MSGSNQKSAIKTESLSTPIAGKSIMVPLDLLLQFLNQYSLQIVAVHEENGEPVLIAQFVEQEA